MARIGRLAVGPLLIIAALVPIRATHAGPLENWFGIGGYGDCPRPSYSPLNYWAPGLVRLHNYCRGPVMPMHAFDLHPEMPRGAYILRYRCQFVFPAGTLVPTPTPPATSRFRY
jgi:hypothetical protein